MRHNTTFDILLLILSCIPLNAMRWLSEPAYTPRQPMQVMQMMQMSSHIRSAQRLSSPNVQASSVSNVSRGLTSVLES